MSSGGLIEKPELLGGTLRAVMTALAAGGINGRLGVGNTADSYKLVFLDWRNREYREQVLRRQVGVQKTPAWAMVGPGDPDTDLLEPDAAGVQAGDAISVPVVKIAGYFLPVAPSATTGTPQPTTVDLTKGPLEALRRRLLAIKYACLNLEQIRLEVQKVQVDSTKQLGSLRNLRGLVSVEKDRFSSALHKADEGRGALLSALDDLVDKASDAMLAPDAPTRVRPTLETKWKWTIGYLVGLLKQPDTRQLLDQVLPVDADAVFLENASSKASQTLVDAACEIIAHAAFWVAEAAPPADAKALLDAATQAIAAGSPPSAGSAQDLITYMSTVAFMGKTNDACGGAAPIACCGAVLNLYTAMGVADVGAKRAEAGSLGPYLNRVGTAVAQVLAQKALAPLGLAKKPDLKSFVGTIAELLNLSPEQKGAATELVGLPHEASEGGEAATKAHEASLSADLAHAQSLSAEGDEVQAARVAMRALKRHGDKATAEALTKLRSLENPREQFETLPKAVKSFTKILKLADKLSNPTPVPRNAKTKDYAQTFQGSVDAAKEVFDTLKEFGVLAEADTALVSAIFGRISIVLGLVVDTADAVEAFEGHDYMKAAGSTLQSIAMVLFLVGAQTGGVTIVVGTVILAIGLVLSSGKTLKELVTSKVTAVFEETFDAFKSGNAGHFPELKEPIEKVEAAFKVATLYDFNGMDYEAYKDRLEAVGFGPSGTLE